MKLNNSKSLSNPSKKYVEKWDVVNPGKKN